MEKIIKLKPTYLIAVVVPEDANGFHFSNTTTKFLCFNSKCDAMSISLNDLRNYEILGTVTAANISFDVEVILEKQEHRWFYTNDSMYNDYKMLGVIYTSSAESSFRSLLSSHGIMLENPYPKPEKVMYGNKDTSFQDYSFDLCHWQTAQDSLVKKIVILKLI